ncbi:polysaccharide pyruvyl transferase family protein [Pseudoalteromonas espejiana]
MLIEIKGVQFVNKGAELMLCNHKATGYNWFLKPKFVWRIISLPYRKRAKVGAYQKNKYTKKYFDLNKLFYFLPLKVRHYFKNRFGIVTEADVNVVLDASGFDSYGDQWSDIIIHQVANEVARLKKHNKKYIFLPQSLGPFQRKTKQYAQKAFSNASLVFAREIPSFNHVLQVT